MMEQHENLGMAAGYLVSVGKLEQCENHGEVFGGGFDLEDDFWQQVSIDRKKGLMPWGDGMKTREFTDTIKQAYDDHPADECGYCAKNMAD